MTWDELQKFLQSDLLAWFQRGVSRQLKDASHAYGYCGPLGIPALCRVKDSELTELRDADCEAIIGRGIVEYAFFNPDNTPSRPVLKFEVSCDQRTNLRFDLPPRRRGLKLVPTAQNEAPEPRLFPLWFEVLEDSRPSILTAGPQRPLRVEFHAKKSMGGTKDSFCGVPMKQEIAKLHELQAEAKAIREDESDYKDRLKRRVLEDEKYNVMMTKLRVRKHDIQLNLKAILEPHDPQHELAELIDEAAEADSAGGSADGVKKKMELAADKKGFGAKFKEVLKKHTGTLLELAVTFGIAFLKAHAGSPDK